MRKTLLSTSSLNFINATVLTISVLAANIAQAQELQHKYSPTIELSTRGSKKRKLAEFDYMQPIWEDGNNLTAIDTKLKADDNNIAIPKEVKNVVRNVTKELNDSCYNFSHPKVEYHMVPQRDALRSVACTLTNLSYLIKD